MSGYVKLLVAGSGDGRSHEGRTESHAGARSGMTVESRIGTCKT
jgi:hypothetical protein